MALETVDLTPRIATEVKLDKAALLSGRHVPELRALLEQRGVLVFRDIHLDDEEEMSLADTLGTLRQDFGRPIMRVTFDKSMNKDHADYFHATFLWHVDGTSDDYPPLASILTPRVLAPEGTGQTEFANTYAAWDDLPEADKAMLENLQVAHTQSFALPLYTAPSKEQLARIERLGMKIQPLVWKHRTGRKSLVLGASVERVMGMDRAESCELIEKYQAWATRPDYVYQHQWRMGDVLMWDNTGTMHRVLPYDKECGRRLHRVTLVGEEPLSEAA
jgi:alpha-ketoglutarate-dependent taurine dioxygenase